MMNNMDKLNAPKKVMQQQALILLGILVMCVAALLSLADAAGIIPIGIMCVSASILIGIGVVWWSWS